MLTRDDAVNQEHPLPTGKSAHPRHSLVDARHESTSAHGADVAADAEDGGALGDLGRAVPSAEDVHGATVGGSLRKAEEEADDTHLGGGLDGSTGHGEAGPDDDHGGEPDAGGDLLDNDAVGELADGHAVHR